MSIKHDLFDAQTSIFGANKHAKACRKHGKLNAITALFH